MIGLSANKALTNGFTWINCILDGYTFRHVFYRARNSFFSKLTGN